MLFGWCPKASKNNFRRQKRNLFQLMVIILRCWMFSKATWKITVVIFWALFTPTESKKWCVENFLNVRTLKKAKAVRDQLKDYCRQMNIPMTSCSGDTDVVARCIVSGFFMQAATLQGDGDYKTMDNKVVSIHPTSCLFYRKPAHVIFNELVTFGREFHR